MEKENLLKIINAQLLRKDLSAKEASLLAVGNPYLISNMGRDRYGFPSVEKLSQLAKVLDLEFYIGPKRIPEHTALDGFAEKAAEFTYAVDGSPEALKEGFLPIPYSGSDPAHKGQGVAPVAFSRAWLVDHGLDPRNLSMVEVPNGRMSPTIRKGMLALIDSSPDDNDNLVWAFLENGNLDVARLSFMGDSGRIIIRDHPDEPPVTVPSASIAPLGRVVWTGYNLKEGDK